MQRRRVSSETPVGPGYYETYCTVEGNAYRLSEEQSARAIKEQYGDAVQLNNLIVINENRVVVQYQVNEQRVAGAIPPALIIIPATFVLVVFGLYKISVNVEDTFEIIFGDGLTSDGARLLWPFGFAVFGVAALVWVVRR